MGGAYDTREIAVNAGGPVGGGNWNMGFSDSHEGEQVRGNEFDSQRISGSFDTGSAAHHAEPSRRVTRKRARGVSRRQRRL